MSVHHCYCQHPLEFLLRANTQPLIVTFKISCWSAGRSTEVRLDGNLGRVPSTYEHISSQTCILAPRYEAQHDKISSKINGHYVIVFLVKIHTMFSLQVIINDD